MNWLHFYIFTRRNCRHFINLPPTEAVEVHDNFELFADNEGKTLGLH